MSSLTFTETFEFLPLPSIVKSVIIPLFNNFYSPPNTTHDISTMPTSSSLWHLPTTTLRLPTLSRSLTTWTKSSKYILNRKFIDKDRIIIIDTEFYNCFNYFRLTKVLISKSEQRKFLTSLRKILLEIGISQNIIGLIVAEIQSNLLLFLFRENLYSFTWRGNTIFIQDIKTTSFINSSASRMIEYNFVVNQPWKA
jgi:hypothetical protein